MVNINIHLFLIPMPFFTLCAFGDFCPFIWVLLHAFLSEFSIQDPLSIVSFCVRDVLIFSSWTEENFGNLVLIWLCFDTYCFIMSFWLLFALFGFQFLAWDHLYIIYCLPCFLSMGILLSPPKTFLNVRWMEPQNSILDLLNLSYFTRIT